MAGLATAPPGYYTFGGGSAEVTRGKSGPIATRYSDGSLMQFTIWDAQVDGNQITDLLDYEGNVLPGTVSPIPDPESIDEGLILFYAPDPYAAVFLDRGIPGNVRIALWAREVAASMPVFIGKADQALTNSTTALNQSSTALTAANGAQTTADGVAAQQDQYQNQAATIDEQVVVIRLSSNSEAPQFAAPMACSITYAALVYPSSTVATSDSNYLTATLSKRTKADPTTALPIVSKNTTTSGEGITANKAWDFAGSTWSASNKVLAAGDVVTANVAITGSVTVGTTPLLVLKYQPAR